MRGIALAVLLLGAWSTPVSAGFRYVPPAEVAAAAEPAAKGAGEAVRGDPATPGADALHEDIEPPSGSGPAVSGPRLSGAGVSGPSVWRVHAGETLREALARWGGRAGTDVVFLTDRRYRLNGDAAFEGRFFQAAQALFEALAHLPHPPEGALSVEGRSLSVTHRAPAANHGETVP